MAAAVGMEFLARRKDGSKFSVDVMLSPLSLARAEGMIATVRDITQRKRVEQALGQSRVELETRVAERTAELSAERTKTVVALEIRARQQAALARLSQRALEGAVLATLLNDAVRLVPENSRLRILQSHGAGSQRQCPFAQGGNRLEERGRVLRTGCGRTAVAGGMGLRIMQYRADTIGAILTIDRARRKGTSVICQFKLP